MDVRVADHQVETSESIKEHAVSRIEELTEKYYSRAVGANVTFGKGPHEHFVCDIVAPVGQGVVLKASHRAPTAQAAFESAADKIETQLRRYSRRLKQRKPSPEPMPDLEANASYRVFAAAEEQDDAPDNPTIVAEAKVDIPKAAVADAVMMMDLRNTTALMFRNTKTGELNMVYRREDGNIGWVEPQ
ncbi:ribosome-associated translation inhibitor RaiA [Sphingomonas sabuli]|uniref:Ribosome hibernation promoting factor n=1 Tax=Sphingomonas sabuli TaxID=2764186 RepID=A0A7G9L0F5_9SPHN|nr:ribosome-associated translation inhibitor RaiA [Sphingomonas sabuli]QNM82104.1 ribosome-associated translation inhibitor RaiA [Sphingomonas sabuli]